MNEKAKTPIESMAALLAEMTERAMEAERERDAAKDDAEQWYQSYLRKTTELSGMIARFDAQTKENEELRSAIAEYIEELKKGAQEND